MKGEPSKTVRERVESLGECIVLEGGERHGWWYRADEWQTKRESVLHALANGQQVHDNVTGYEPTGEQRMSELDRLEGLCAVVWRWTR